MKKDFKNKKIGVGGFTLIEALVAIAIVLVGVTTVFTVARFGIASTSAIRNRVTAMFLAQESFEAIENLKDSNLHKIAANPSLNWLDGITVIGGVAGPCPSESSNACGFDARKKESSEQFFRCSSSLNNNCQIYVEGTTDFYRQAATLVTGSDSGFKRQIYINEIVPGKEADVRVIISKPNDSGFPPFDMSTYIYNWF